MKLRTLESMGNGRAQRETGTAEIAVAQADAIEARGYKRFWRAQRAEVSAAPRSETPDKPSEHFASKGAEGGGNRSEAEGGSQGQWL